MPARRPPEGIPARQDVTESLQSPMALGDVFLAAISTGVITDHEMDWVTRNQNRFSRAEEATALRLGRLLDEGVINPGSRLSHGERQ